MSRDGVFPKLFGTIHPKFKTPATGTLVLAFIALIGMYGIVTFDSALERLQHPAVTSSPTWAS